MNTLAKISTVAIIAALFVISMAHAVVDPNENFSDDDLEGFAVYPHREITLMTARPTFSIYTATQSRNCDFAGPANPSPAFSDWDQIFGQIRYSPSYRANTSGFVNDVLFDAIAGFSGSVDWFGGADWEIASQYAREHTSPREYTSLWIQDAIAGGFNSEKFRPPTIEQFFLAAGGVSSESTSAVEPQRVESTDGNTGGMGFGAAWKPYYDFVPAFKYDDKLLWNDRAFAPSSADRLRDDSSAEPGPSIFFRIFGDPLKQGLDYQPDPFQYMIFPDRPNLRGLTWPGPDSGYRDMGADQDPIKGTLGQDGTASIDLAESWLLQRALSLDDFSQADMFERPAWRSNYSLPARLIGSINFKTPADGLSLSLYPFVNQQLDIGGIPFTSLMFDEYNRDLVVNTLEFVGIIVFENNSCRVILAPTDPNYKKTGRHGGGSWGQTEDDQWAIKRVGYTDDDNSAWNQMPETASPVVVAVIDTGLDWHHLDISHENIWRNEDEIPDNGIDDDNNGYVDDLIGWDFFARNNKPWDFDGHGTIVTGIIAATQSNDAGIAGINPHAKIMVLKAVNNFGTTRASYLAEAIVYAVDNGARVINISVGGPHTSFMEQAAIDYAHEKGVMTFAASGNDGVELDDFGPGGAENLLTVGATHVDDRTAAFSNFGEKVDLVAPGVDVLSLRARYTDANYRPGTEEEYEVGTNYVGDDKRYIHVSGTSFSTPIVAATASMLFAKDPDLTAADVEQILLVTAEDIESAGKDIYAGYGMVDAQMALSVEPGFFVQAEITDVEFVQSEAGTVAHVIGTIDATGFKRAWMQMGPGEKPGSWKFVGQKRKYPIRDGKLGTINMAEFRGSDLWQVVINVEHRNGVVKRAAFPVNVNN